VREPNTSIIVHLGSRHPAAGDKMFEYTAYFRGSVYASDDAFNALRQWAARANVTAALMEPDRGAIGMQSKVRLEPLTEADIDDFRKKFRPDEETTIPIV
jgi:hypothetical protein